jgi:hypothetical protein
MQFIFHFLFTNNLLCPRKFTRAKSDPWSRDRSAPASKRKRTCPFWLWRLVASIFRQNLRDHPVRIRWLLPEEANFYICMPWSAQTMEAVRLRVEGERQATKRMAVQGSEPSQIWWWPWIRTPRTTRPNCFIKSQKRKQKTRKKNFPTVWFQLALFQSRYMIMEDSSPWTSQLMDMWIQTSDSE